MEPNIYLTDILSQPGSLSKALARFEPHGLQAVQKALQSGSFDRVIVTGMGASLFAAYPAWLALAQCGAPAAWVETGELIHYAKEMVTPRSLVWIISQSGRSAEIVALLELLRSVQPAGLLATVNDLESPLAQAPAWVGGASALLPILAAPETSVSTRTYLNSLALTQLAARYLCDESLEPHMQDLQHTAEAMAEYLSDWEKHMLAVGQMVGVPKHLVLLGRGSSLATAACGALILGESAKTAAFSMSAGEFRHGPIELCAPDLTVVLFAGEPATRSLNRKLLGELVEHGAKAFWVKSSSATSASTQKSDAGMDALAMPQSHGIGLPLAEMLPVQMLALYLCVQKGIIPGTMRFIGKVTTNE